MSDKKAVSDVITYPHISTLCERLRDWANEVGQKTPPQLDVRIREALDKSKKAKIDAHLVIFLIAVCQWWFRVYRPTKGGLRRALKHRLTTPSYTPHSYWATNTADLPPVPRVVHQLVDKSLARLWEPQATAEMDNLLRTTLYSRIEQLATELCHPLLVSENKIVSPKQGGYPQWGPWMAAIAVHYAARKHLTAQDPRSLAAANAILLALRGSEPHPSLFYKKRREVNSRAPELIDQIVKWYEETHSRPVESQKVNRLIDADCFPSLASMGGMALLVTK